MRRKLLNSKMVLILAALLVLFIAVGIAEEERTDASGQWKYALVDGCAKIISCTEEQVDKLTIPDELDGYQVTSLGDMVFKACKGLTDVTIPDSVTSISIWTFAGCGSLANIDVAPNSQAYEQIDGILFDKPRKILRTYPAARQGAYSIPDGVLGIGVYAFVDCDGLAGVTIPESVTSIGAYAFLDCESLAGITIPGNVERIDDFTFMYCASLADVTILNGVTNISHRMFSDCINLVSVIIPDSVTSIGEDAFDDCEKLTLSVRKGSFTEQYAKENDIPYVHTAAAIPDDDVFVRIGGSTFTFSSGVGGWSTELIVSEDGSFTGHFHDWDMGDTGDDYPEGTRYECFFTGVFAVAGKIDPFTYELRLTALNLKEDAGVERIEDGVRVISAGPYGIENGDVFMLYCPGRVTADLPENFLEWMRMPNAWEEIPDALPFYGLYNAVEEFGFFSFAEQ